MDYHIQGSAIDDARNRAAQRQANMLNKVPPVTK